MEKIVLGIGLIGFVAGFIVQFRLRHHVSLKKVRAETDPSQIFKNGIPPKKYLTEHGVKLHRIFVIGLGTFIGSIALSILIGIGR